jgi:hypothetical protein
VFLIKGVSYLDQVIMNGLRISLSVLVGSSNLRGEESSLHLLGKGSLVLGHVLFINLLGVQNVIKSSLSFSLLGSEFRLEGA